MRSGSNKPHPIHPISHRSGRASSEDTQASEFSEFWSFPRRISITRFSSTIPQGSTIGHTQSHTKVQSCIWKNNYVPSLTVSPNLLTYVVFLCKRTRTHTHTDTAVQRGMQWWECLNEDRLHVWTVWRPTDSLVNLTDHTVSVQVSHHASGLQQSCQAQGLRELRPGFVDRFPGQVWSLSVCSELFNQRLLILSH